jgi:hypothetical protein
MVVIARSPTLLAFHVGAARTAFHRSRTRIRKDRTFIGSGCRA